MPPARSCACPSSSPRPWPNSSASAACPSFAKPPRDRVTAVPRFAPADLPLYNPGGGGEFRPDDTRTSEARTSISHYLAMHADAHHEYVERVVDLLPPDANAILNLSVEEARERVLHGSPESVRAIDGSFALMAREGKKVRLARSMDRPMRYFLAKRAEGPA